MIVDKNYEIYKNANDYKHKSLTVSLYTLVVIEVVVFLVAVFLICISAYLMALYGPKPTESRQLHESSSIFNRAISSFLCYKISDYLSMPSSIYSNRSYVINLLNSAKSMKTISQIFYDYNLSNISTNSLDKPKLKNNSQIYLNKSLKSNYEQVDRNANSEYDNVSKFDLRMTKEAEKGAIINLNYYIETFDILLSFVDRNYSSTLEFINNEDYVEIVERVTLTTNMVLQIYKNKIIKINQSAGYLINFYKYISDYLNYVYSVELIVLIVCVCILAHTIRLRCVEILKIPKSSVSIVYHYFFDQLPFSETRFLSKSTKSAIREFFEYFVFFIIFLVQLLIFYAFFASAQKIVGNLSNISISVFNTASIYPYYFIGLYQELFLFSNHSNKRDYMFNVLLDARILLRISDTNKNETEIVPDLNINEIKPIFPFVSIPVRPVKVHNYYLNDAATRSNQLFHWIRKIIFSLIESLLSVQNGIGNILSSNIDILFLFMPFANDYMADEITIFIWTLCSQHVGFGFTIVLMFFSIISLCTYSIKRMLFMLRSTKFTNRIIALAPMDTPFVDPVSGSFVYPTPPPAVGTSDIISNFPVGFITVDKTDTIIDMNETAQEFYGGSDIIGCKTIEIKLTKSYTDDGKTRKFVVQKGKMRKLPYLYPYEEIDGYEYLFINETTKQYNTEIQIKQLNTELIEQHKLLMPASLGNYHNFDIDHIIFLKQYCFVDIEFPDDFENDYFMAIKENVFDIASQFSTLFFLNYRRSSTYALFSSFNVRSHQRQFIRDALKCAQCLYSLFNNNRETNKVKIVISQGKKCISCLNDKRNVSFTFHSKSNYKSAKLMMQANPGDIIIEKSLLNYATDIDIKYNQSETFSINGNTCEYVVLDKGIQFTDGFRYNPTNL
ncbi:hypothetical protein TRFO_34044 [Tritrichomonas foetus]|uniref:Uncharacterized protein n=1 Tax=Tritrichomonas foetus TaxID=1144522 RepID=A0A1J4JM52_9EUKA|nr:hypothetical protein TRFO_34044 [Tritrichomonas foetus]|eukprot:OHS99503.1 hypothetical protein TRFO_34044 [Tritrichomonas foetus]